MRPSDTRKTVRPISGRRVAARHGDIRTAGRAVGEPFAHRCGAAFPGALARSREGEPCEELCYPAVPTDWLSLGRDVPGESSAVCLVAHVRDALLGHQVGELGMHRLLLGRLVIDFRALTCRADVA